MYITGTASNACELLEALDDFVVNKLGDSAWQRVHTKYIGSSICEAVWAGKGEGTDKIFIQARVPTLFDEDGYEYISDTTKLALDGLAGFDYSLKYYEQAGSIQQWLRADGSAEVNQPMLTVAQDSKFSYWFFANTQRIIVVIKLSTVYESAYMGFINPISAERQFPYPLYIAGNGVMSGLSWNSNTQGSFVNPSGGSGHLRRADGQWRLFDAHCDESTVSNPFSLGTLFPYNTGNLKLAPNYINGAVGDNDNALILPIMLCTTNPYDINGLLDDVYFISGTRDIASEQIVTIGSEQFIVFSVKDRKSPNTYFTVKLV